MDTSAAMMAARGRRGRRDRHARGRVPRPIDARLRTGRRPDRAAPRGWCARRPAQHRLPGHDGVRRQLPSRTAGSTWTSRSARSGSPRATPSRNCARLPQIIGADDPGRRRPRGGAVPPPDVEHDPHDHQGSGAHEAVHEHLALHEVRDREPVLRDRRPGGRGLHEHPARDPRGLPARRGPARPRLRRRSLPVQGHDAAGGVHVGPLPDGPGGDADQRGHAGLHRLGARAAPRQPAREDRRHPGHGLQGGVGRHPRLAVVQAAQAPGVGGREGAVHRSLRGRCAPGAAGRGPGAQRDPGHRRAAPRLPVTRPRRSRGGRHLERRPAGDPAPTS